jgi:hypothetical protein
MPRNARQDIRFLCRDLIAGSREHAASASPWTATTFDGIKLSSRKSIQSDYLTNTSCPDAS